MNRARLYDTLDIGIDARQSHIYRIVDIPQHGSATVSSGKQDTLTDTYMITYIRAERDHVRLRL